MEMKSKYLHEQYLFEAQMNTLNQMHQQNTFMNGGGGGPAPASAPEPTPPPPSYATELRLEFNNDLQTVESDFGVDPRSLSTWNAKFPNAEFESIEIDTTNAYVPIITLKGNTVNEGQIADRAFYNKTTISSITDGAGNCLIQTSGTESFAESSIEYVDLGALTTLDAVAFKNCTSLTTAYLPSLANTIGGSDTGATFIGCTSLSDVLFDSLQSVGSYTFYNCTALTSLESFKELTTAGIYSFSRSGLRDVTSNTLTNINRHAFFQCSGITEINLGTSDSIFIDKNAFQFCDSLTSITTVGEVTLEGEETFQGVAFGGIYDFQGGVIDNGGNINYLISIGWTSA
jgi:hypothetical protein